MPKPQLHEQRKPSIDDRPGGLPDGRWWSAPEVTGVGRETMAAPLVPWSDVAGARSDDPAESPWWRSLDGTWSFRHHQRPEQVSPDDHAPTPPGEQSLGEWSPIEVPGCWVLAGWDHPIYTNVQMPFRGRPPEVPDENPTGVYRRDVVVPRSWSGRRIVVCFGGAESVLYVHVDGHFVGMGKDSRLPMEFDITDHVRPGRRSTLTATVVRWSDASWIEDQDHWWMAGLHRSVSMYATPLTHLADVETRAGLADDFATGTLEITARVGFHHAPRRGWRVSATLETLGGKRVVEVQPLAGAEGAVPVDPNPYLFDGHLVRLNATVPEVRRWSAEVPDRYRVVVRLADRDGVVTHVVSQLVGFRRVEVRDRALLINGAAVQINGMNRHDHHPDRGKAVTPADMADDLIAMKRANVNAVRCSHYPNDHRFLDLCDELGLYVIDEANVESHATLSSLCHDPRYTSAIVDRVARMVLRDRNHPSVIAWSLGNESGYGAAHDAAAAWVRRVDPTRPLHYESPVMGDLDAEAPVTDLVCPMYASVEAIVAWSKRARDPRRPLILCEYSHAMGNSNGGLADYFAAFESHPGLQGGFIWEWKDHGLRQQLADGQERFAYGGQFGDEPNDANFVADGIVAADGQPHPALTEFAWLARPVTVSATTEELARRVVRVRNRDWFRDTSWLRARWELTADGRRVAQGTLAIDAVAPRCSRTVEVPFDDAKLRGAAEAHLTVRWFTRRNSAWAPAGTELSWDQLAVDLGEPDVDDDGFVAPRAGRAPRQSPAPVELERNRANGDVEVRMGPVSALIETRGDGLVQLSRDGHGVLAGPIGVSLWRAPTDNDGFKVWVGSDDPWHLLDQDRVLARWLAWGLDRTRVAERDVRVTSGADGRVRVGERAEIEVPGCEAPVLHRRRIELGDDGWLVVREELRVPAELEDLPRVGSSLVLDEGYRDIEWFGLGPHENYPDRRSSAIVGRWRQPIDEMDTPYLMPQTSGARGALRWARLEAVSGGPPPVRIEAPHDSDLHLGVSRSSEVALWEALDRTELVADGRTHVHLDAAVRGLGTASCGPDTDPAHLVRPGRHRWCWRLRLV